MSKIVHYLYDPLCGWCYGAAPALSELIDASGIRVALLPASLFSGDGARAMSAEFAEFAWSNDQRITRLTGQQFSERYRTRVLDDRQQRFDSGPATLALTAVAMTDRTREFEALEVIQRARYVDGDDVTSLPLLASLLEALGLQAAATLIAHPGQQLLEANNDRIVQAKALLQEFGAQGVPTFIAESTARRWLLPSSVIFSDRHALMAQLDAG